MIWDTVVSAVQGHEKVDGVDLKNTKTGEKTFLPVEGVFVFVGIRPNTAFLGDLVELDRGGFVITDSEMAASRPGVFAAGDIRSKELRQISTAVGDGATAAFNAQRYLENLND